MIEPLTPEQIELLRKLPVYYDDLLTDGELKADQKTWDRLKPLQIIARTPWAKYDAPIHGGRHRFHRTPAADTLLATIDAERAQHND